MRTWLAAAESWGMRQALVAALSQARVANRGAKAASANTAAGLTEWWRAPQERLDELVGRVSREPLAGRRVVLQVHGVAAPDAVARLADAGAEVIEVDAYRLSLPADPAPAEEIIRAACAGQLAAVTFVMAPAVHNLFLMARQIGLRSELRGASQRQRGHRVRRSCVRRGGHPGRRSPSARARPGSARAHDPRSHRSPCRDPLGVSRSVPLALDRADARRAGTVERRAFRPGPSATRLAVQGSRHACGDSRARARLAGRDPVVACSTDPVMFGVPGQAEHPEPRPA